MAAASDTVQLQRAREAKNLLDHPMLKDALSAIESKYMEQWMVSDIEDAKSREFSFRMIRSAQLFRILLTKFIEDGTLIEADVAETTRQKRSLED
jgi:hypothetical protein